MQRKTILRIHGRRIGRTRSRPPATADITSPKKSIVGTEKTPVDIEITEDIKAGAPDDQNPQPDNANNDFEAEGDIKFERTEGPQEHYFTRSHWLPRYVSCGGLAIVIPMLIMSFNPSKTKNPVTTSVFVVFFAFFMGSQGISPMANWQLGLQPMLLSWWYLLERMVNDRFSFGGSTMISGQEKA